jgi:hypothetical protein
MKTSSAKAKGRSLQKLVADKIKHLFQLNDYDVRSTPMGCPGSDIMLSEKAIHMLPYDIECKKTEKINVWEAYDQSVVRAQKPIPGSLKLEPVVILSKNRRDPIAVMDLDHFLNLVYIKHTAQSGS